MALIANGNNQPGIANVNVNSDLAVTLPLSNPYVGKVRMMTENDSGSATGQAYLKSPETSTDYRLRVGTDTLFDVEDFNYSFQNTNKHFVRTTGMSMGFGGGFGSTNSGSTVASGAGVQFQTYRWFPIFGAAPTYCEMSLAYSAAMPTNTLIEAGLFTSGSAVSSIPTDGIYFRFTSAGVIGVINNNGVETTTGVFAISPQVNSVYKYSVTISDGLVEYWIDDTLYGSLRVPVGLGQPMVQSSLPFSIRHYLSGTASGIFQFKISNYTITLGDFAATRLWSTTMGGAGNNAIQALSGSALNAFGQTANNVNSVAPSTVTLSNTIPGYPSLGGSFVFVPVAGSETDYALFGYQTPVPAIDKQAKSLVIRGIWIDSYTAGTLPLTGSTVLQWSLGVGGTTASLSYTVNAPQDTSGSRTPRRLHLGTQNLPNAMPPQSASIGLVASRIDVNLDAPVFVDPGSFCHIILKMPVGAAATGPLIRGAVGINGYWE